MENSNRPPLQISVAITPRPLFFATHLAVVSASGSKDASSYKLVQYWRTGQHLEAKVARNHAPKGFVSTEGQFLSSYTHYIP